MTSLVDQPLPGMPESDVLPVHPVAGLFPMLPDDELAELAADIKARGQLQPIMLDTEGRVLDGRNRLAACRIADVEPTFATYGGGDPDGYALAVNVARRSLSKGQIAMIVELAEQSSAESVTINSRYRDRASVIRQYGAHDLAPAVVAGDLSLAEAYDEAQKRKRAAEARRADMVRLKREAPDLYELVEGGTLPHPDAVAALSDREEKAKAGAALAERVARLPADLADRVYAGTLDIAEAESVVKQRSERVAAWAEKIRAGLETFSRMAGNPVPAELEGHLSAQEIQSLSAILGALA